MSERPFLPYALPDVGDEEVAEVVDTLRSGWITTGPKARRFEDDFAQFLGGGVSAVAVNSATAGLHLALEAIGVGPGDEVITTTHTFTATAEVIRYLGADPVFVDIDPATLTLDPQRVADAVTRSTKAIMPVHYAGRACRMPEILAIAGDYSLRVIEDAAHALPTTCRGDLVGTLGSDATVFSFYANKPITTGEGGMLVTREESIAARARIMRLHGIDRDAFNRYVSDTPAWYYSVVAPGYKYNMTDMAAAVGVQQLRKAWKFQHMRERIARRYDEELADLPLELPPKPDAGDVHAWHLYAIRICAEAAIGRDQFIECMAREGVGCSVHYIPLHLHPYWRDTYGLKKEDFPHAQAFFEGAVSLPIYTRMTEDDQEHVIAAVRRCLTHG